MSHDLWIHRFVGGEPAHLDLDVVRAVLQPYSVDRRPPLVQDSGRFDVWIRARDGGDAELLADAGSILVERPAGGEVLGIIAELTARLAAVIIDPADGASICRAEERAHLPVEYQRDAVVIEMTGPAVQDATTTRRSGAASHRTTMPNGRTPAGRRRVSPEARSTTVMPSQAPSRVKPPVT